MLKQEYHRDPRTDALADSLGVPRYGALGLRVYLGQFAAKYAPDGSFSGIPPQLIARAATWEGDPQAFVAALIACGIMDIELRLVEDDLRVPESPVLGGGLASSPIAKEAEAQMPPSGRGDVPKGQGGALPPDLPPVKPDSGEIARRLSEEPETAAFFAEAQGIIGAFGHPQTASLIMAHDYYGLSWDALLVLLHAVHGMEEAAQGIRPGTKTYESFAKKLYAAGASSAEEAESFFVAYKEIPGLFNLLSAKWGLTNSRPTPAQREKLERWVAWGFSDEMIDIAYQTALDKPAKQPFLFADKILADWHGNGIRTPEDVRRSREAWAERLRLKTALSSGGGRKPVQTAASGDTPPPNHDLNKAEALSRRGRLSLPSKNSRKG